MRPELTQFEQVEAYVNGTLSNTEKAAFEAQMQSSTELQEMVQFQELAKQAALRSAIRAEIAAVTAPSGGGFFKGWMIGAIIAIVIGALGASYYFSGENLPSEEAIAEVTEPTQSTTEEPTPVLEDTPCEVEEEGLNIPYSRIQSANNVTFEESADLNTWVPLKTQIYNFSAGNGSTIEGEDGTLIIVPSNAFLDQEGRTVRGEVSLELVEALKWEDMLAYNLTTTADDKILSTAGMLKINAFVNGEEIIINEDRPLYIEVPTEKYDPEMMAWEGNVTDGKVNWENPVPLKKYLTIVDLALLDFIPTGFDLEVGKALPFKGHTQATEHLVDSLYYSLGYDCEEIITEPTPEINEGSSRGESSEIDPNTGTITTSQVNNRRNKRKTDPVIVDGANIGWTTNNVLIQNSQDYSQCYINPSSVKTIYEKKFQQSYIATKEFEERIQAMHKLELGQTILDIYLNNLDLDLTEVDQMAANALSGQGKKIFSDFAAQGLTNVDATIHKDKLMAYYNQKLSKYTKDLKKKKQEYQNQSAEELAVLRNKVIELQEERYQSSYAASGSTTAFTASQQRIVRSIPSPSVATGPSYGTQWFKFGWVNLDKYMKLLNNGTPVEVIVKVNEPIQNSEVYQCINPLSTIVPLNMIDGAGSAKFPNKNASCASTYSLVIGKKDDQLFYGERKYNPYSTSLVNLTWEEVDRATLYQKLRALSPINDPIVKKMKAEQKRIEDALKAKREMEARNLRLDEEIRTAQSNVIALQRKQAAEFAFIQRLIGFLSQCPVTNSNQTVVAVSPDSPEVMSNVIRGAIAPNDRFSPWNGTTYDSYYFTVYDNSGKLIFGTDSPLNSWYGMLDDETYVLDGQYTYTLKTTIGTNSNSYSGLVRFTNNQGGIVEFPDVGASFTGGQSALREWISSNTIYPQSAIENEEQGSVYTAFIVEGDGSITNIVVERGISTALDNEAIRLIQLMPNWMPANTNGAAVRTRARFPIVFTLD
ncbi:MAG: energy transducer TonB [Crocinitomicaceae bacterium]|nr:energy transducer TonB [Crocinitomicaceae bacterium]